MPICKERYSGDKLISRLCIKGDDFELMTMKHDFKPPEYELSLVGSCDNCPIFPSPTPAIDKDELKNIIKEVLRETPSNRQGQSQESYQRSFKRNS